MPEGPTVQSYLRMEINRLRREADGPEADAYREACRRAADAIEGATIVRPTDALRQIIAITEATHASQERVHAALSRIQDVARRGLG